MVSLQEDIIKMQYWMFISKNKQWKANWTVEKKQIGKLSNWTHVNNPQHRCYKLGPVIAKEALNNDLARCGLFLLENDSIDRNQDSNAEGSEYSNRHFDFLILHPVQIVHVLCMKIEWFVMAMCMTSSHPLHPCWVDTSIHCHKTRPVISSVNSVLVP